MGARWLADKPASRHRTNFRAGLRLSRHGRGGQHATVVLHVAPEAAVGGPLALVRDGDLITLDVPGRRLQLHVEDAELDRRKAEWTKPRRKLRGGYESLY